jgi:hypothetical protein
LFSRSPPPPRLLKIKCHVSSGPARAIWTMRCKSLVSSDGHVSIAHPLHHLPSSGSGDTVHSHSTPRPHPLRIWLALHCANFTWLSSIARMLPLGCPLALEHDSLCRHVTLPTHPITLLTYNTSHGLLACCLAG